MCIRDRRREELLSACCSRTQRHSPPLNRATVHTPNPNTTGNLQAAVLEALSSITEVARLKLLSAEERERVLLLEAQAEDAGAAGGIMDMVNEGINVVLPAHHVYAVLASPMGAANPPKPWTVMMDESDQVLGCLLYTSPSPRDRT